MEAVSCSLATVSLINHPSYTALSYVWGDPNHRLPIYINGMQVSVTKNLALALQYIRKVDRDQILWVDAVCINQADVDEKNSQVRLMGTLYSEAEDVIIWLGEADPTTDELAHFVQEGGVPIRPEADTGDFQSTYRTYIDQIDTIRALFQIVLIRPWWRRVWTVQECVLPKKNPVFHCGFKTFSWELFFTKFYNLYVETGGDLHSVTRASHPHHEELEKLRDELNGGASQNEIRQIVQAISALPTLRICFHSTSSIPLVDCFALGLGRQASVAQDYIYGFLALVARKESERIDVFYRRSYWETYRDFYELLIEVAGPRAFQVFLTCSFNNASEERPSWMPDFSTQKDVAEHTGFFLASAECFGEFKEVSRSDDREVLRVQGVFLDTIDRTHTMPGGTNNVLERVLSWGQKVRSSSQSSPVQINGPPLQIIEASKHTHISQLFFGNIRLSEEFDVEEPDIESCWDAIAAHHQAHGSLTAFESSEFQRTRTELRDMSILTVIDQKLTQIFAACASARVVKTRAGIAGICFANAQPGDEIACLYGCPMLFILRPRNSRYRLIGGVHVPGLMDWKVLMHCVENGDLGETTFLIQ